MKSVATAKWYSATAVVDGPVDELDVDAGGALPLAQRLGHALVGPRGSQANSATGASIASYTVALSRRHAMGSAAGTYITIRDGAAYEYAATWDFFGYSAFWRARVRRGDAAVFDISGRVDLSSGSVDLDAAVRRGVERRIEARDGVG